MARSAKHTPTPGSLKEGEGTGFNVNIPWTTKGVGDADYMLALHLLVLPIIHSFEPDLLLISSGFDAADKQFGMSMTPPGFGCMLHKLMQQLPSVPIVATLEGGYEGDTPSLCTEHMLRTFLGQLPEAQPQIKLNSCTAKTIKEVAAVQEAHWPQAINMTQLNEAFEREKQEPRAPRGSARAHAAVEFTVSSPSGSRW